MITVQVIPYHIFFQDGEKKSTEDANRLKDECYAFNHNVIKDLKAGLTIFGCIYPITIDDALIEAFAKVEENKYDLCFEAYLDLKQKRDCYYAKPLLYRTNGTYIARYALTEGVPSIFPMKAVLPFGYNQKIQVSSFYVNVVVKKGEEFVVKTEVPYDDFLDMALKMGFKRFDHDHLLLTVEDRFLDEINRYSIKRAEEKLSDWLSDIRELGVRPAKIKYTSVIDDDGHECFIFKYKKKLFDPWLLGIVSERGTFSDMKPYSRDSEEEDARKILNKLKVIWQRQSELLNL